MLLRGGWADHPDVTSTIAGRLTRRLLAVAVLTTTPLLAIAVTSTHAGTSAIEDRVDSELQSTAHLAAKLIETRVGSLSTSVALLAARPGLRHAVEGAVIAGTLQEHLDDFRSLHPGVTSVAILDEHGVMLGTSPSGAGLAGKDYSFRDYFRGAQQTDSTYVGEVIVSHATGSAVVPVATPVRSPLTSDGAHTVGFVVAGLSLDAAQELADSLSDRGRLHLRVADRHGLRVAGPESTSGLLSIADDSGVAAALGGRSGMMDIDRGGYTDRVAYQAIDELGWAVTVDIDHTIAYAGANSLKRTVAAGVVLLLLLAAGAVYVIGRLERRRLLLEQERERAVRAQAETNVALERSNEELAQFAYVASHDLAEPLRAISGFAQLLAERYDGRLDEQADRYIGHIVTGTKRMRALIDDLLAVSRVVNAPLPDGEVDLESCLNAVEQSLRPAMSATNAEIRRGPLPTVAGDEIQLRQVLQNLLANAIKYRSPDRVPVITVTAGHHDDGVLVVVADNGIGIDEQYRERVFRMFQRLHGRDEFEGTGIGLAVVKRIVERHGGSIWIEDNPGGGCRFCLTLRGPALTGDPSRSTHQQEIPA